MNQKTFVITAVVVFGIIVIVALAFSGLGRAPTKIANPVSTSTTATPPAAPSTYAILNAYSINRPNALILVDSQGRRTGRNPMADVEYHEIPGTTYSEEGSSGQLYFSGPAKGLYVLYVLSGKTSQYTVSSKVDDGGPTNPTRQIVSGDIQKGSMVAYTQNYDLANVASSTLVLRGVVSSTASITSAPPHNLPPPPVPGH